MSAHDPSTLEALRETLRARVQNRLKQVLVRVPVADGETIAALYREAEVITRVDESMEVVITARVPRALLGRLIARPEIIVEEVA